MKHPVPFVVVDSAGKQLSESCWPSDGEWFTAHLDGEEMGRVFREMIVAHGMSSFEGGSLQAPMAGSGLELNLSSFNFAY